MKQLKKDLQAVLKGLKALTKTVERTQRQVASLEKAQKAAKAKPKGTPAGKGHVGAKVRKASAPQMLLQIIQGSKKGVDTSTLRAKTGFSSQKVQINLYRLKKQGKIKRVSQGVYAKA